MNHELQIIAGIGLGFLIALFIASLAANRKMTAVHGARSQKQIGFYRAVFTLIRMYYFGYSNTLFTNAETKVKVREEEREMRKKHPSRSVMVFEVER